MLLRCRKHLALPQFIQHPKNNMKKIIVIFVIVISSMGYGQSPNKLFGKDPIINLENLYGIM